jgi:excisionase family DNA binding protein
VPHKPRQLRQFQPDNPVLTSEEVAELLGVSAKTVVNMAKNGRLPARRIPGTRRYLFFEREIFEVLEPSKVGPEDDVEEAAEPAEEEPVAEVAPKPAPARSRRSGTKAKPS